MPRICTICAHLDRDSIETELLAGKPFREVAGRFRTSPTALFRHRQAHLPDRLLKARKAVEVSKADSLIQQVEDLQIHRATDPEKGGIGRRPAHRPRGCQGAVSV